MHVLLRAALGSLTKRTSGDTLPSSEIVRPDVRIDRDHLAHYAAVCGFGVRDELPATYPHVLAFEPAMTLMTAREFPFPMLGSVHVANTITQHRPLTADDVPTLRVRAVDLRPHERGVQFDVVHTAEVDGVEVWRDVSTYLRRTSSGSGSGRAVTADDTPPPTSAIWRVPDDLGRRYAAVSGDHNPIHLGALSARPFGFPRAIAHGMWSKARCLAALEGRLPSAFTVAVAFKRPVLLPSKIAFSASADGSGWRFALHDPQSGRPHLSGQLTVL